MSCVNIGIGTYSGETAHCGAVPPQTYAVIVAAGSGRRAGGGLPKQFHLLAGQMAFLYAVRAFLQADSATHIIVVVHPDYRELAAEGLSRLCGEMSFSYDVVDGGATRWQSVKNGLAVIPDDAAALVAVHDGARPLVTAEMIAEGWKCGMETGACVAAVPVTDSLRVFDGDGSSRAVDRSRYMAVQTPQVFEAGLLKAAYSKPCRDTFTDDASVVEAYGHAISTYPGDVDNLKITTPSDFDTAELLLNRRDKR